MYFDFDCVGNIRLLTFIIVISIVHTWWAFFFSNFKGKGFIKEKTYIAGLTVPYSEEKFLGIMSSRYVRCY